MFRWIRTLLAPITPRIPRNSRMTLGNRGEVVAARHLRKQGYKVLMRNFEAAGGEVDIIARKGALLVFVEVKTRRSGQGTKPYQQVDQRKRRALTRAARAYLSHYKGMQPPCRFDVISIVWPDVGEAQVEHLPNAFTAE